MNSALSLSQLIELMDPHNKTSSQYLYAQHGEKINIAIGSKTKHQAWPGGYLHHTEHCMNIAVDLYHLYKIQPGLPFSLSDALVVLFLHDIEKPFKYTSPNPDEVLVTHKEKWAHLKRMVQRYNFNLSEMHWNALKYIHGEGNDYHRTKRVMNELAGFVHACDVLSARTFHNYRPY